MKPQILLKGLNYKDVEIPNNIDIENIAYDSRKVKDNSCFIAIRGREFDGHNFISEAIDKGANIIVAEQDCLESVGVPIVIVENSRKALSRLAANFYKNPSSSINTIGVTGTNGKTSVTQIIKQLLDALGSSCGALGTLGFSINQDIINTSFTTPESIELHGMLRLLDDSSTKNAVLEVSSHSLDQDRVSDVDFNIAVFTNLSQDHLDYHETMQKYFESKSKLFKGLNQQSYSVINTDDPYGLRIYNSMSNNKMSYGLVGDCDLSASQIEFSFSGSRAKIKILNKSYDIKTNLMGEYNILNILAAIGATLSLGYNAEDIIEQINSIDFSIPGRMEMISKKQDKLILIDYAHSPDAFYTIFSNIKKIDNSFSLISLFGCGGDRDKEKRAEMAKIAEEYCDRVFITSDNPRSEKVESINKDIVEGFSSDSYHVISDRSQAIKNAINSMTNKTILLVLGKGREEYQMVGNNKIYHSDIDIIKKCVYAD